MASASVFGASARPTRYAVLLAELFFKILRRGYSSGLYVVNAALDSLESFQLIDAVIGVAHLQEEVYRRP